MWLIAAAAAVVTINNGAPLLRCFWFFGSLTEVFFNEANKVRQCGSERVV